MKRIRHLAGIALIAAGFIFLASCSPDMNTWTFKNESSCTVSVFEILNGDVGNFDLTAGDSKSVTVYSNKLYYKYSAYTDVRDTIDLEKLEVVFTDP